MISWKLIGWRSVGAAALLTLAACSQPTATNTDRSGTTTVSDDHGEGGERSDDGAGERGEGGESGESGESGEGGNSGPG
jgi:hypothetical protein